MQRQEERRKHEEQHAGHSAAESPHVARDRGRQAVESVESVAISRRFDSDMTRRSPAHTGLAVMVLQVPAQQRAAVIGGHAGRQQQADAAPRPAQLPCALEEQLIAVRMAGALSPIDTGAPEEIQGR